MIRQISWCILGKKTFDASIQPSYEVLPVGFVCHLKRDGARGERARAREVNGSLTSLAFGALPEKTYAFAEEATDMHIEGVANIEDWNSKTSDHLADTEKPWHLDNGSAATLLEFFSDESIVFANLVVDYWFALHLAIGLDLVRFF